MRNNIRYVVLFSLGVFELALAALLDLPKWGTILLSALGGWLLCQSLYSKWLHDYQGWLDDAHNWLGRMSAGRRGMN